MPMELHAFTHEVPGSSPGGSNIRGHSSMAEHEVSSNLVVALLFIATNDTEDTVTDTYEVQYSIRRERQVGV
jgi:hypothetical protein